MTVDELREQLAGVPGGVEVYIEDVCCGCSNLADEAMFVDDPDLSLRMDPVLVITG